MQKWTTWIVCCVIGVNAYASPVGNTWAPDLIQKGILIPSDSWIDFRLGYEGDFVSDGRLNQFEEGLGRVDCYEQETNSGTVTLNFLDRVDVYGLFGSSKTKANWRISNRLLGTIQHLHLETKSSFLWGAGARAILFQWCNAAVGAGGRYSSSHYDPDRLTLDGLVEPVEGTFLHWREWQVNFDISYKIHFFTPYIGFKYSNARTHLGNFSVTIAGDGAGTNAFKNRIPVGLYLGCGLTTGKYFMLNIEGRLIDEEAVSVSADFRF